MKNVKDRLFVIEDPPFCHARLDRASSLLSSPTPIGDPGSLGVPSLFGKARDDTQVVPYRIGVLACRGGPVCPPCFSCFIRAGERRWMPDRAGHDRRMTEEGKCWNDRAFRAIEGHWSGWQDRPFDFVLPFVLSVAIAKSKNAQDRPFDFTRRTPVRSERNGVESKDAQDRPFDCAQDRPFRAESFIKKKGSHDGCPS